MPDFSVVDEAAAPAAPRTRPALVRRMREYEGYVTAVKPGRVGRLNPGAGETAKGLAIRISRAGRRIGKRVHTWISGDVVYFRVD
jgi:hypothetical protein